MALATHGGTALLLVMAITAAPLRPTRSFSYTNPLFGNTERAGDYVGGSAIDWDHLWIEARRWAEQRERTAGRLVSLQPRWTPLQLSGWRVAGHLHDAFSEPLVVLVPVGQRQRLEQRGYRCFQATPRIETIAGGLEVYRIDSTATLSGWPDLVALEIGDTPDEISSSSGVSWPDEIGQCSCPQPSAAQATTADLRSGAQWKEHLHDLNSITD